MRFWHAVDPLPFLIDPPYFKILGNLGWGGSEILGFWLKILRISDRPPPLFRGRFGQKGRSISFNYPDLRTDVDEFREPRLSHGFETWSHQVPVMVTFRIFELSLVNFS